MILTRISRLTESQQNKMREYYEVQKNFYGKIYSFKESFYFTYMIKNLKNGKIYIGRSVVPLRRCANHYRNLKAGKHSVENMQEDFDKYGAESFDFKILAKSMSGDEERMFQDKLKTYDENFGYNYKDQNWVSHKNGKIRSKNGEGTKQPMQTCT